MPLSFEECNSVFVDNETNLALYSYTGSVFDGNSSDKPYITIEGCRKLCGPQPHYYEWDAMAFTLTTWVLPIMGLLLGMPRYVQLFAITCLPTIGAPFEPNQFLLTMHAFVRWLGSPLASLSAILWNIKLTGKCSMLLDLSTHYHELPSATSNFSDLRNSFIILSIMNQYEISADIKSRQDSVHAERLVRLALFARWTVPHPTVVDSTITTMDLRAKLAYDILIRRRRGVVPNVLTYLWFVFAIVISIQACK